MPPTPWSLLICLYARPISESHGLLERADGGKEVKGPNIQMQKTGAGAGFYAEVSARF